MPPTTVTRWEAIAIKSPVSWVGSKAAVLPVLYALFPQNYSRYIEPFGGSGAVLLGKAKPDPFEVYNDYNSNLVNLFRCMRDRPVALIRELGFLTLNSREDFNLLRAFLAQDDFSDPWLKEELALTEQMLPAPEAQELQALMRERSEDYDVQRAASFLKLLRYSYSSTGDSYACQPYDISKLFSLIRQVSERLSNAVIEHQDFETLIRHYDRPESFFYCDPPYFMSEYVYTCGFQWEDHLRLHDVLAQAQGKWLLSYNDCPEIRALYEDFQQFSFTRPHRMSGKAGEQFPELLVGNYDLFERQKEEPKQLSLLDDMEGDI